MKSSLLITVIIIFALQFFYTAGYSQESKKDSFNIKNTEITIAVADIFAKNERINYYYINTSGGFIPYITNDPEYIPRTNLQLGAKFHTLKGAVRLSCGFNYSNYTSEDKAINDIKIKKSGSNIRFATGYEWHYTIARVNIYYGADFSWALSNYNFKLVDGSSEVVIKSNVTYLGINPLVGVNYFITPHLSVGTELRFTAEIYTGKEKVDNVLNNTNYEYDINGLRTYLGPLGFISVNIHF